MNQKIKVFISYAHNDKEIVEKLIPIIEECNVEIININNLDFGHTSYFDQNKTSIASSDIFIPLLTEASSHRGYLQQEIGFATALNKPVLPITTEKFPIAGMFPMMHVLKIDDDKESFKQLLTHSISEIFLKNRKTITEPPFEAYSGKESYLFVSYSHKDSSLVYPEINRLHQLGFRIWYDEGIDPGNEWPEEVAIALEMCSFFLVFITSRSVVSKNVRNEINFAINHEKPFLAIHIEETTLPKGLELRMGDIQAILKWRMQEDLYFRKMEKTLPKSLLKDTK